MSETSIEPAAIGYYIGVSAADGREWASERITEWSYADDPHGYCHDRPYLMALLKGYDEAVAALPVPADLVGPD